MVPEADISVQIECSDDVNSGTTGGQTTIGIQVSPGAYRAAQGLNLINSQGGVMALVSDNYGVDPTLATGWVLPYVIALHNNRWYLYLNPVLLV